MNRKHSFIAAMLLGAVLFILALSCDDSGNGGGGSTANPAHTYIVTFDSNGGSEVAPVPVNFSEGDNYVFINKEPKPTKAGYIFGGWFADAGLTNIRGFPLRLTGDIKLYARWVAEPGFTVTFDTGSGSPVPPLNNAARVTAAPSSGRGLGWDIVSWTDGANPITFPYAVTKDVTLYAVWVYTELGCELDPRWRTPLRFLFNG